MANTFKIVLITILLFHLAFVGKAQNGIVDGRITSSGKPIEFATVGIKNTSLGSISDTNGKFLITDVPPGDYELIVSIIGFETKTKTFSLNPQQLNRKFNLDLKESISTLDAIMVTSGTLQEVSRLESPVPVEVYTPEFFQANPNPSFFESLQNVNGVRPQLNCNVCNTGDIHINGLEGPYTMVTIDGMPIVSGLSTVYGLTGIPQSLIERMEVVKGPASTLYGSEAVGGLINLITKKPLNTPIFSGDVFGTSWGEFNTDLGFKMNLGASTSLIGINYFNYQNPIDNNKDGFTDVTLQDRISVFNKWSFERESNREFSIAARYIYEDRWGGQMNWDPGFRGGDEVYGESIYTHRWETFGIYQLPVRDPVFFEFSANGHRQNSVYGDTRYLAEQYVGFGQLRWSKSLNENNHLLLGTALRYTFYDDNTPATATSDTLVEKTNKPSVTYLPGLFVQNETTLSPKSKLLVGLRYDHNSIHGNIFSPRVNYKWTSFDKKHTIRLSLGNGYRVANVFTEDHAALTGARDVVFEEDLKPETSWNVNLNAIKKIYTQSNTFIGLDLSAFYTNFDNRIIPDYESDPNEISYRNLDGYAISRGVSLNADINYENGFSALIGGTFQDVYLMEEGEKISQLLTEKFSAVWNVGYTISSIGLTIDYTGNLYGPMRLPLLGELDDRPEFSPWWSVQNIQVTKEINTNLEIYGGVKNLLNYTPPANSIARSFDPFDRDVAFNADGQVIATPSNPNALTFDPTYVFAPNQGIRTFFGLRYTFDR